MKKRTDILTMITLVALLFLLSSSPAAAESVTLYPVANSSVNSSQPDTVFNEDNLDLIHLPSVGNLRMWPFIQFDLSSIPVNSTINSAAIYLFVAADGPSSLNMNVYRCTGAWSETSVTWNNAPAVNPEPSAENVFTVGENIYRKIDMPTLVQGWVNRDYPNNGFKIGISPISEGGHRILVDFRRQN